MANNAGTVKGAGGKSQHVDLYRKLLLRRKLLEQALPGAAYVPFIGDGDIAIELYQGRHIYGADIDAERVQTAQGRLPGADVRVADCDGYPFGDVCDTFAVADFDVYSYPYDSFRAFWQAAQKTERMLLFFTDGQRQSISRTGVFHHPNGSREDLGEISERRKLYNNYWLGTILPWFTEYIQPWQILDTHSYLRDNTMLYWAAVIENRADNIVPLHLAGVQTEPPLKQRVFKKFNPRRREIYLQAIRDGKRRTEAARVACVDYATVWAAMKQDPAFAEQVDRAEVMACDPIENALRQAAESGNVPAIQMWLYNRAGGRWKDQKTVKAEVTGSDGGPLELHVVERIVTSRAEDRVSDS